MRLIAYVMPSRRAGGGGTTIDGQDLMFRPS